MAVSETSGVQPSLQSTGLAKRRERKSRLAELVATFAALLAVGVLAVVVITVFLKGVSALSWDFLTKTEATFGESGGGIAHAIVGTALLVALATAMALPFGVLVAIYVSEFAHARVSRIVGLTLDILNGVPSIVIGIFVFSLLVVGHQQSAFAGSVALGIIMVPYVSRATQEVLALVPQALREASYALGVSKWRTVLRVVLPTAVGGILTGTVLAVARAAGETAPLLFTCSIFPNAVSFDISQAVASIPVIIFTYSESPDPGQHTQAWAAAFLLIAVVLVTSLAARAALARSRRKLESR